MDMQLYAEAQRLMAKRLEVQRDGDMLEPIPHLTQREIDNQQATYLRNIPAKHSTCPCSRWDTKPN